MIRPRESKSAPVGVVSKVLRILEALDTAPSGLQLRQIAQQTGVNKSTAYRFLAHLENMGYLFRDDAGAYIVGPKLSRLGTGMPFHATLRKISRPVLQNVARATGETVNLAVLDGQDVLYLDVIESSHIFRMVSQVGMRRLANCTALGKAILAFLPMAHREDVLASFSFGRSTAHSHTELVSFRRELAKVRERGFAIDDREAEPGARCVAAPVVDSTGDVNGAISVSGPTTRVNKSNIPHFVTVVREGAYVISSRLGYTGILHAAASSSSRIVV
jgi:DNA-binding IclR family transcriptional regulator